MDKIRHFVLEMTRIALDDEAIKGKEYLINLMVDEGLDAALLVLWYVYAENLRNNHVKSVLLNILTDLENERIHKFAMAIIGEQFIRKDVEMINCALDYIDRRSSKDALALLFDIHVSDKETMDRIAAVRDKIQESVTE